jgi:RNA polymerase sigma-70 factor (ECF subfamily)
MQRAQAGDEEAYAELLVLLAAATRSYVRLRAGAAVAWSDDVVQDTLMAEHRARHTFDPRRPFVPWFYAIARNRFVDVLRREQRVRQFEVASDAWAEFAAADRELPGSVDLDAVRRALASLPPRQREIIEAIKLRDESVRDIADRLGMTVSAVKVTAHRGYRALKQLLRIDLRAE